MANSVSAINFPARQPPAKEAARRPKTSAERAKAYRERKRAEAEIIAPILPASPSLAAPAMPPDRVASRPPIGSMVLMSAAFGLAGVGVTMNGWFAQGLGSTPIAGHLFLAVGVAADLAALVLPSVCARAWQARQRGAALAGWAAFFVTFAFAITSGVGFASVNITDTVTARAARTTPGVISARDAVTDAVTARDRECRNGIGRYCRDRESAVIDRRAVLDAAMRDVAGAADPQTTAAIHLAAWASGGYLRPAEGDFSMLRLMLLALLPQLGGILAMVARAR